MAKQKRALCVGINDYPGTQSDLSGCVNDAKDWRAALESRGYKVTTLLDGQATRKNVLNALRTLIASGRSGDKLCFTFSGHGSWIPDANGDESDQRDEMLCPHDIGKNQYLLDDDLAEVFGKKANGVNLYFISDSCHSGTVSRFAPPLFPDAAALLPKPRFLPPAAFLKGKMLKKSEMIANLTAGKTAAKQKYSALLMAGCLDVQFSYDANFNGKANGAFTFFALQELAKKPQTPRQWMLGVRKRLPTSVYPQTPQLYGSNTAKDGVML